MAIKVLGTDSNRGASPHNYYTPLYRDYLGAVGVVITETFEDATPTITMSANDYELNYLGKVVTDTTVLNAWCFRTKKINPNTWSISHTGDHLVSLVRYFSGVRLSGNPIISVASAIKDVSNTELNFPAVAVDSTIKNYYLLNMATTDRDTITAYLSPTFTMDGGYLATRYMETFSTGNGGACSFIGGYIPDGGTVQGTVGLLTQNSKAAMMTIALEPEPEVNSDGSPIVFIGSQKASVLGGAITLSWMPHQVDYVAILFVSRIWDSTPTPDGFERIGNPQIKLNTDGVSTLNNYDIFWCRATSNRMENVVISSGSLQAAALLVFKNCKKTGNPFNSLVQESAEYGTISQGLLMPNITTEVDNSLVVGGLSVDFSVSLNTINTISNNNLKNLSIAAQEYRINSPGVNLGIFTGLKEVAGEVGNTQVKVYSKTTHLVSMMALVPEVESTSDNKNGSILDEIGIEEELISLKNGLYYSSNTIGSELKLINLKTIENILSFNLGANLFNNSLKKIVNNVDESYRLSIDSNSLKTILNEIVDSLRIERNSSGFKKSAEVINIKHGDNSFATYIVTIREDKYGNVILRAGQDLSAESLVSKQIDIYIENQKENLIFQTFYDKQINLHIENGGSTYADGTIYEVINLIYLLKLKGLLIKKQTLEGQFEKTIKLDGVFNKKRRLTCYATDRTGD